MRHGRIVTIRLNAEEMISICLLGKQMCKSYGNKIYSRQNLDLRNTKQIIRCVLGKAEEDGYQCLLNIAFLHVYNYVLISINPSSQSKISIEHMLCAKLLMCALHDLIHFPQQSNIILVRICVL